MICRLIIASGYPDAGSVTDGWMHSPPHKAIILGSQFREVGIAKDGGYWTAVWGSQ